jgi:hypothetical protein
MDFKDLVSLYFERSNAIQTFWNFYLTVILGLSAFFGSQTIPVEPNDPRSSLHSRVRGLRRIQSSCPH